jgi:hypothetical protein
MSETKHAFFVDDYAFIPKFRTDGSYSLAVISKTEELEIRDEQGWVDIHEIYSPVRSIAIRGSLPSECLRFDFLNRLLSTIYSEFQIPESLSRDVIFFRAADCIEMSRTGEDDDQAVERISTSRSFLPPRE